MPYRDELAQKRYHHEWYLRNKEKKLAQSYAYIKANPDKRRRYANRYYHSNKGQAKYKSRRLALWNEFIDAYGGACSCCGEGNRGFLTVEHIGGGGLKHRRQVGSTASILADIKRMGYPVGVFTVLCFNCNMATSRLGRCPHKDG